MTCRRAVVWNGCCTLLPAVQWAASRMAKLGRNRRSRRRSSASSNECMVARQWQLLLVRAFGMQVGALECRSIRSYLWFEVSVGRS